MNRTQYLSASMLIWVALGTACRDLTEDDSAGQDSSVVGDDTGVPRVPEEVVLKWKSQGKQAPHNYDPMKDN